MPTTLIYGGTGGIGGALARRLVHAGHRVHLVARDAERLALHANELGATFTAGDVRDPGLFARVAADAGDVDGLVYAVGTIRLRPVARVAAADLEDDWRINSLGAALAAQAALPALKRAGAASIVFFSSVAARTGFANHASIAMAKAAVEGLTVSLAAELAPRIRVNAIAPSLTRTPLAAGLVANEQIATGIAQQHALQRLGEADDLAATAAFLLGPDAGWITGQVIAVDGGRSSVTGR